MEGLSRGSQLVATRFGLGTLGQPVTGLGRLAPLSADVGPAPAFSSPRNVSHTLLRAQSKNAHKRSFLCGHGGTRTLNPLRELRPERSAYTNSATCPIFSFYLSYHSTNRTVDIDSTNTTRIQPYFYIMRRLLTPSTPPCYRLAGWICLPILHSLYLYSLYSYTLFFTLLYLYFILHTLYFPHYSTSPIASRFLPSQPVS